MDQTDWAWQAWQAALAATPSRDEAGLDREDVRHAAQVLRSVAATPTEIATADRLLAALAAQPHADAEYVAAAVAYAEADRYKILIDLHCPITPEVMRLDGQPVQVVLRRRRAC
jgi:hypothetical protein